MENNKRRIKTIREILERTEAKFLKHAKSHIQEVLSGTELDIPFIGFAYRGQTVNGGREQALAFKEKDGRISFNDLQALIDVYLEKTGFAKTLNNLVLENLHTNTGLLTHSIFRLNSKICTIEKTNNHLEVEFSQGLIDKISPKERYDAIKADILKVSKKNKLARPHII